MIFTNKAYKVLATALTLLLPSLVLAQEAFIQNSAQTVFYSTAGTAAKAAVDNKGNTLNILIAGLAGTSAVIPEDLATLSAQPMMVTGGINNRSFATENTTQLDATIQSFGDWGNALTTIVYDTNIGGASPVRREDDAFGASDALTVGGQQRQDVPTSDTGTDGDVMPHKGDSFGRLYVNETMRSNATTTNPSTTTATSTTELAANTARKGFRIQNNSAANICCSESGSVLTNITGTLCNVITPGSTLQSMANVVTTTAITCYQTSGGTITTITATEW